MWLAARILSHGDGSRRVVEVTNEAPTTTSTRWLRSIWDRTSIFRAPGERRVILKIEPECVTAWPPAA